MSLSLSLDVQMTELRALSYLDRTGLGGCRAGRIQMISKAQRWKLKTGMERIGQEERAEVITHLVEI